MAIQSLDDALPTRLRRRCLTVGKGSYMLAHTLSDGHCLAIRSLLRMVVNQNLAPMRLHTDSFGFQ